MSVVPLPERRERLAAIDVGSNSIRLLVAEYGPHSGLTVIDEVKEQPRLAAGVAQTGRLDPAAMQRAIDALKLMQGVCERRGVSRIAAVATAAVREATNGEEFAAPGQGGGRSRPAHDRRQHRGGAVLPVGRASLPAGRGPHCRRRYRRRQPRADRRGRRAGRTRLSLPFGAVAPDRAPPRGPFGPAVRDQEAARVRRPPVPPQAAAPRLGRHHAHRLRGLLHQSRPHGGGPARHVGRGSGARLGGHHRRGGASARLVGRDESGEARRRSTASIRNAPISSSPASR